MSGQINMKERKLPQNFWEDVLILEYSITSQTQNLPIDKLQQLIHLFCEAIEYYESIEDPRYIELTERMQSILIKEHVLRALEKQAQAKSASPPAKQNTRVNRNGSFLTPHAKARQEKERKDSFMSYGSESEEDQHNLSFEDILDKSSIFSTPSHKLQSTFATSGDRDSGRVRKSAIGQHRDDSALLESPVEFGVGRKRSNTQFRNFVREEVKEEEKKEERKYERKENRIGRKELEDPKKLITNVHHQFSSKVKQIKLEYQEQAKGFQDRIAQVKAQRKAKRKKIQEEEQKSLSFSNMMNENKVHWSSSNRDQFPILSNSLSGGQSGGIVHLGFNMKSLYQITKRSESMPNLRKRSRPVVSLRRARSNLNFSHKVAEQGLLYSVGEMPSAILGHGLGKHNTSHEYINVDPLSGEEELSDDCSIDEGEIEQDIIQPVWQECEERYRVMQEKLEKMKEDIIQRSVEQKLTKVQEVSKVYNKRLQELMESQASEQEMKLMEMKKNQDIQMVKEQCDQLKREKLEQLKKTYYENQNSLMQVGEKEEKIESLTSKLVQKMQGF